MDDNPAPALGASLYQTAYVTAAHECKPHTVSTDLGPNDMAAFMALHRIVTASTPFVKPRTTESVMKHVAKGHFAVAVNAIDGAMIGQALVALPDLDGASNLNGYPIGGALQPEKCAIIQSVGIHPDHRKCGLPEAIFAAAAGMASAAGRTHLIAKLNVENGKGFAAFARAGYKQYGLAAKVAGEDYTSVFMVKTLGAADLAHKPNGAAPC